MKFGGNNLTISCLWGGSNFNILRQRELPERFVVLVRVLPPDAAGRTAAPPVVVRVPVMSLLQFVLCVAVRAPPPVRGSPRRRGGRGRPASHLEESFRDFALEVMRLKEVPGQLGSAAPFRSPLSLCHCALSCSCHC